jgi:hypothetical protein
VEPDADPDTIRAAYRRLARRYHPDSGTAPSEPRMALINEAWETLGDAGRRRSYDAALRAASVPAPTTDPVVVGPAVEDDDDVDLAEDGRARWAIPLPWLLVLGALAVIFVFTAFAARRAGDDEPRTTAPAGELVDGVITVDSCIRLDDVARAYEVTCGGPHLGVVRAVVDLAAPCPLHTEGFYDRAGSELICIERD